MHQYLRPLPQPRCGTLEQVLSRRRRMLMDMVDGFELEVRDALTPKDDGGATQKQVLLTLTLTLTLPSPEPSP